MISRTLLVEFLDRTDLRPEPWQIDAALAALNDPRTAGRRTVVVAYSAAEAEADLATFGLNRRTWGVTIAPTESPASIERLRGVKAGPDVEVRLVGTPARGRYWPDVVDALKAAGWTGGPA